MNWDQVVHQRFRGHCRQTDHPHNPLMPIAIDKSAPDARLERCYGDCGPLHDKQTLRRAPSWFFVR